MDGTLVDTEAYWMRAQAELMSSWEAEWTAEDQKSVIGIGLWEVAAIFRSRGVGLSADEIVVSLTDRVIEQTRSSAPWRPGARELLEQIRDAGVPTALVTMSIHRLADAIAASVGFDAFDVVVAGEDVEFPKPHPAPYLRAAALLGVDITECVALEDSVPGVASAVASGAVTVGLPLHTPIPESDDLVLWNGLEGKTFADVTAVFESRAAVPAHSSETRAVGGSTP